MSSRSYLSGSAGTRSTPQSAPIPGREAEQVENNAGGFVYKINELEALRRFLILGTEGGTYYADQRKHTKQAMTSVRRALDGRGPEAVAVIVDVSERGAAPKTDPAIYALAMACGHPNEDVRKAALAAIPRVCRTGTHLFHFLEFVEEFRGWGRALKRAVGDWYNREDVAKVAYQAVKYRQRDGWTHADALRLAKPTPETLAHDHLFKWIVGKADGESILSGDLSGDLRALYAYESAQRSESPAATARLIADFGGLLPREALKTEHLTDPGVNRALLEAGMPMTALMRNLANLTRYGVLEPMGEHTRLVAAQLTDPEKVKKGRLHPLTVLNALMTYKSGHSERGTGTWNPVREIIDALDETFYLGFDAVEPTGKRTMLALDVSGSMVANRLGGYPQISAGVGAAVMSMVQARSGDPYVVVGFGHGSGGHFGYRGGRDAGVYGDGIMDLSVSPRQRLDDVVAATTNLNFGGTDCSLPMRNALKRKLKIDTFVVYTDNETWAGPEHPSQSLKQYRDLTGIDAKLVVVGMTATEFSIADPSDKGMLDVVGFDTAAPQVIGEFSAGRI